MPQSSKWSKEPLATLRYSAPSALKIGDRLQISRRFLGEEGRGMLLLQQNHIT